MVKAQMSKRISVTLPDRTHRLLELLAEKEGTSLSDLSSYILRKAVDLALERGEIKDT
ncbi:ribbon-helix-helix domain-containing protein [[Phormidium] sp. LEGE 05292]|uniref:ribbon-helix-helix domain-containing protein n=1 Tax=[Phormidium] sp. LEGE 05292 TaxID=767427 RepID=UPI001D144F1C|nr:hypothetical protein [Phormidium sp. LEGE 05292]